MANAVSPEDRGWLAGILEGEGTFTMNSAGRNSPVVVLSMTDFDVVDRAHALTGLGSVTTYQPSQPNRKPVRRWQIATGHEAAALMAFVYPFMGRRRQARILEVVEPWMSLPYFGKGTRNAKKTHCAQGHPFEGDNLKMDANGRRRCVACIATWNATRAAKHGLAKAHPSGVNQHPNPSTES